MTLELKISNKNLTFIFPFTLVTYSQDLEWFEISVKNKKSP